MSSSKKDFISKWKIDFKNFILDYTLDVQRQGIVMQQINNFLDGKEGRVLEDLVTSVGCGGQGDLCQGRNGLTGI